MTATQEMLTLTTAQHAQAARSAAALEEETANLQRQAQQLQREAEDWGTVADLMGPTGVLHHARTLPLHARVPPALQSQQGGPVACGVVCVLEKASTRVH